MFRILSLLSNIHCDPIKESPDVVFTLTAGRGPHETEVCEAGLIGPEHVLLLFECEQFTVTCRW